MPALNYEALYIALLDDVRSLASSFRSLQLGASSREAPAFEDAHDMTKELIETAERRENPDG